VGDQSKAMKEIVQRDLLMNTSMRIWSYLTSMTLCDQMSPIYDTVVTFVFLMLQFPELVKLLLPLSMDCGREKILQILYLWLICYSL